MSEAAVETPADETVLASTFEPAADEAAETTAQTSTESAAETTTDETAETTAETATEQDWRSNPEVLDFIRAEVEALTSAQAQTTGYADAEQETELEELDLFAEDGGQRLAEYIRNTVQDAIRPISEPLAQQRQAEQAAEGKQLVADAIASIDVGGDFDRDAAAEMFDLYKDEAVQRYGVSNRALEYAAEKAARRQRTIEEAAEKRGAERLKNELAAVGGAPREGAAATQGVRSQQFSDGDELSVANRWQT